MKPFMNADFCLKNDTAKTLFHNIAKKLPILDYHCHLHAKDIYENKEPVDIAQLWLAGDHYKWRLMRANGIAEEYITGSASGYEKFKAFAKTIPLAIGNPLYHWSHLELQRYFGIEETLSQYSATDIWARANAAIQNGGFRPRELMERSNVYAVCTTDDPADDLVWHEMLVQDDTFEIKVLPAFRPDRALEIWRGDVWTDFVAELADAADTPIASYDDLLHALSLRMDAFAALGCVASDHGFERMPCRRASVPRTALIFEKALKNESVTDEESECFQTELLLWLGKQYSERKWVMELHLGSIRARNSRMTEQVGRDSGFDSIADHPVANPLGQFMDTLETERALPRMVLFCLNNRDSMMLASMAGNFQDESFPSKIQFGTAWWMQDHRDGMIEQMKTLANGGVLGNFIGMLTDSRSFLSYTRHEYFRRILCNLIGEWVEDGDYPDELDMLKKTVRDICFENVKSYLQL